VLGTPGFGHPGLYKSEIQVSAKVTGRGDAIRKYLSGRELSPIEGIWIWGDSQY